MATSQKDMLLTALDKLDEKNFVQFKTKLSAWNVKKKYERIPSTQLDDADRQSVADLIMKSYGTFYGIKVSLAVLDAINEKKVREDLLQEFPGARKHFLHRNQKELVEQIRNIDPVLRDLLDQHLLTEQQCTRLRRKPSSEEKMRSLCDTIRNWSFNDKDEVYDALRRHNYKELRALEQSYIPSASPEPKAEVHQGLCQYRSMCLPKRQSAAPPEPKVVHQSPSLPKRQSGRNHFLDKNQKELKEKIKNIDSVLRDLLDQHLLKKKQYTRLTEKSSSEEKMRSLCDTVRNWSYTNKNKVYDALRRHNHEELKVLEQTYIPFKERESAVYFPEECYWSECPLSGKDEDSAILVSPVINGTVFRLELQSSGLFLCSKTGIKFQVTRPVNIEYEIESWRNYAAPMKSLNKEYEILGPLFNIKTSLEPGVVSAVHLPHCLCLKGLKKVPASIKFMHCKDWNITLEVPTRVEQQYVVLENPTFSLIGIIWYPFLWIEDGITKYIPVYGMVLIYYGIVGINDPNHRKYKIHLYLMPDNLSVETDIQNHETKLGYTRIQKPPQTEHLYNRRRYVVKASENARVLPKKLLFRCSYLAELYPYTEITVDDQRTNEGIAIYVKDGGRLVWETEVDRGEIMDRESASVGLSIQEGLTSTMAAQVSQESYSPCCRHGGEMQKLDVVEGCPVPETNAHFVDEHRPALIEAISLVEPIVEELRSHNLLTDEQYDTVCSKPTSQEQMRELYRYVTHWGNVDKGTVYRILRNHNRPVINRLETKDY